jgi:hypothetical protein
VNHKPPPPHAKIRPGHPQWTLSFIRTERALIGVMAAAIFVAALLVYLFRQPGMREWLGPTAAIAGALGCVLAAASAFTERTTVRWLIVAIAGVFTGWAAWYPTVDLSGEINGLKAQLTESAKESMDNDRRLRLAKSDLNQMLEVFPKNSVLTRAGVVLASQFGSELKASDFEKRRRPQDFAGSQDLIDFVQSLDAESGHVFYYQGEIARKIGASDNGHENFMHYLEEEPRVAHARDGGPSIEACRSSAHGYCLQRTAWINQLLANDFYGSAKKAKDPSEGAALLKSAFSYACAAAELFNQHGFSDQDQLRPTLALIERIEGDLGVSRCPK